MMIIELKEREDFLENAKRNRVYFRFQKLLTELRMRELPHRIIESVNQDIEHINSTSFTGRELRKSVKRKQAKILKLLEKELNIVPKKYYLTQAITVASAVTAVLSLSIQMSLEKMTSLGKIGKIGVIIAAIGIAICVPIGFVIGLRMDKKAFKEGRQLDMKYSE